MDRKRKRLWPLNRFATVGAALVLAIAVGDAIIISMQRDASIAAYETATTNLARGMSTQTAHSLTAVDKLLIEVAAQVAASSASEDMGRQTAALLDERGKAMAELASFAVADADGRVVAATPGGGLIPGADLSTRDYYASLREGGATAVHVESGENNFVMARRLVGSDGRFDGVVVATLSTPALQDFFKIAMPPRRKVTLMTEGGAVLMQFPRPDTAPIVNAAHPDRLAVNRGACVPYFGPDLLNDAPVIGSICRFKDLPFALETSAPAAEALAFWKEERVWLALGGVVASLAAILLLWVFARQVRRLEFSELSLAAEKREAETAHQQLDVALSNIIQGVCFFDGEHRLIVANLRFRELYRLPEDVTLPGATLSDIVAAICKYVGLQDLDRESFLSSSEQVARARAPNASVLPLGDGRTIAIQSQPLTDGGWVATHEDITERRQAEEKISFLAKHDMLTGLVNRSVLTERLAQLADVTTRGGRFAILFLDLDRFKAVNDTLGHDVGDALLKEVAARLKDTIRTRCTIARFGGDEFVILLTGVAGPDEIAALARGLIETVSSPYKIGQHKIVIGASIGIELSKDVTVSPDTLLKNADIALYRSKAQGRGVFHFFEQEMDSQARDRHRVEAGLRNALAEHQFEIVYQPIFETRSDKVCAFEALLRWNQPERGQTAPGEFIEVAEQSGLIIPIGEFLIRQACHQAAQWSDEVRVAVNLSPMQFRAVSLIPVIEEALAATGLAPHRLEVEITESMLLEETARNMGTLHKLRDLGVGLVMDDFGVGYSSLGYLRDFPFDKIKIDRSFIRDLTEKPETIHFVRAIVGLCSGLNIRTTAEGVESEAQLELLKAVGCTEIQGFLLGRPGLAAGIADVLARRGPHRTEREVFSGEDATATSTPRAA